MPARARHGYRRAHAAAASLLARGIGERAGLNINVHDNLVRHCLQGIKTARASSRVTEVIDDKTFVENGLPLEWRDSHCYRGWNLAWHSEGRPGALSVIDSFDPDTLRFKLKELRAMKVGDRFDVFPPTGANWSIHGYTVVGCSNPVVLEAYGSETSSFRDNVITRDGAASVKAAVQVSGRYQVVGNRICGFDEGGCAALSLAPDGLGRACPSIYRANAIEACSVRVAESRRGLWKAASTEGGVVPK